MEGACGNEIGQTKKNSEVDARGPLPVKRHPARRAKAIITVRREAHVGARGYHGTRAIDEVTVQVIGNIIRMSARRNRTGVAVQDWSQSLRFGLLFVQPNAVAT